MKHSNKIKKFGRVKKQRNAMLQNLAASFILQEKTTSTETKIKTLRPLVEKMITTAKQDSVSRRRNLLSLLDKKAVSKLFSDIGPRFNQRPGGYTKIIKLPPRLSDNAKMATLRFID